MKGGCTVGIINHPQLAEHQQSWHHVARSSKAAIFLPPCHRAVGLLSVVASMWERAVRGGAAPSVERLCSNLRKACWCSGMRSVICSSADRTLKWAWANNSAGKASAGNKCLWLQRQQRKSDERVFGLFFLQIFYYFYLKVSPGPSGGDEGPIWQPRAGLHWTEGLSERN